MPIGIEQFHVNRPFIFYLQYTTSNARQILFFGKILTLTNDNNNMFYNGNNFLQIVLIK